MIAGLEDTKSYLNCMHDDLWTARASERFVKARATLVILSTGQSDEFESHFESKLVGNINGKSPGGQRWQLWSVWAGTAEL